MYIAELVDPSAVPVNMDTWLDSGYRAHGRLSTQGQIKPNWYQNMATLRPWEALLPKSKSKHEYGCVQRRRSCVKGQDCTCIHESLGHRTKLFSPVVPRLLGEALSWTVQFLSNDDFGALLGEFADVDMLPAQEIYVYIGYAPEALMAQACEKYLEPLSSCTSIA